MLKKAMFGLVKVSTCMNRPESAEFTMDGLLIKDFVTPILRKIFTFISMFILGKESEKCRKR